MLKPSEKQLTYLENKDNKTKEIPKEYFLYGWTERDIFRKKLKEAINKVNKE